jgi:hypothetical protein
MLMRRVGASPGWVLLCLIPLGFVFVIGVAAFRLSDRLAGVENAMRNKEPPKGDRTATRSSAPIQPHRLSCAAII